MSPWGGGGRRPITEPAIPRVAGHSPARPLLTRDTLWALEMPEFHYIAMDRAGQRVAGVLGGATEQAVLGELEARALTPVTIRERRERVRLRRGLPARQLGNAYAQLADLLKAGVPLLRGLRLLGRKRSSPRLAAVFKELADEVADGEELAEAMRRRGRLFPEVHVAMVRAGERGGFLEQVLERLGILVISQADLRGKVLANLIYPVVLVFVGSIILGLIFAFGVPMFRPLYERIEGGLPAVTVLVLGVSSAIRDYAPVTLAALALAGAGAWWALKRPDVRRQLEVARTRAPVIGPLTRSLAAARFCRMLGTLLANGVPMVEAMRIARDAAGNTLLAEAIDEAADAVRAGESLAPPLERSGMLGEEVVEMISVGESANNLDEVLLKVADNLENRIDRLLGAAVRLIEPLLLTLIAGVILLVAAGLILPMTKIGAGL